MADIDSGVGFMTRRGISKSSRDLVAVLLPALLCLVSWAAPKYKILYAFSGDDGGLLYSGVAFDRKGNLYGVSLRGGPEGYGTVYKLRKQPDGSWSEKVLQSFSNGDPRGDQPSGTPVFDSAGNLYGTTELDGAHGKGTVFRMAPSPSGWTFEVLYDFCSQPDCGDGGAPWAGLLLDAAGNLYGTAGGVFELSPEPGGWTENVLYPFCLKERCADGFRPLAGLIADAKGNLFGTTVQGGAYKAGTVYKLRKMPDGTWQERVLHSFGAFSSDGNEPGVNSLALDSLGNLYGVTDQGGSHLCGGGVFGCGTVFRLTRQPNGHWKETILHNFKPDENGFTPTGVVLDGTGNLYGSTSLGGGRCGCGVVFKMTPKPDGAWNYSVLHTFTGDDGASPYANLILDDNGNLYGTAHLGGPGGAGVVFELTP